MNFNPVGVDYPHVSPKLRAKIISFLSRFSAAGQTRNEVGPQLLQVGPYEELLNVSTKWVLEKARL